MKTSTMLLIGAGAYIAYTLWKKQQAATTGTSNAAVTGPAGAAVSGPAGSPVVDTSYDEIDYVPDGWGPTWVSIMPGGGRRRGGWGGGGGHHHHGGGGHRGRH